MERYLKTQKKILLGLLLVCLAFLAGPASAGITLAPTLLVIEGRNRYADVSVINSGNTRASYEVGWLYYRMEEGTGFYKASEKSITDFDLPSHLALTPKRINLMPKSVQRVRMGLRLKDGPPPPGDYRAHLHIREAESLGPPVPGKEKGVSMGVRVNVGFTIPVVYRVGVSDATAQIGDVSTQINKSGKIEVSVPITRSDSKYGILGNLSIYYGDKLAGQIKNANIFPEIRNRIFKVSLNVPELSGGSLRIVYKDYNQKKDIIYSEKTIPVGQ